MASPWSTTQSIQSASAVNVANFVSSPLRFDSKSNNYPSWKEQMLCLVVSQDLLGFIDGTVPEKEGSDKVYRVWRRTDRLVKGWILGALSNEVVQSVVVHDLDTARDVWLELENMVQISQVANFGTLLRGDFDNYSSWKEQMLGLIVSQNLLGFIDGTLPPEKEASDKDKRVRRRTDRLVKGWILGALSDEVAQSVVHHFDTTRDVWLELENMFQISQVANLVTTPLRPDFSNYSSWKEQMLGLIESQNLLGFIDGTQPLPEKEAGDNGEPTDVIDNWRTDRLVKRMILGALSDELVQTVVHFDTARNVWLELENMFEERILEQPSSSTQQEKDWREYVPLHKAILKGDWYTFKAILERDPDAVKARVSSTQETPLHIAVSNGKRLPFVVKLLNLMTNEMIAITDRFGFNALHTAAWTGNTAAARKLIDKLPDLLYLPVNSDTWLFPIHLAAEFAHIDTLQLLISETKDNLATNPFADESGITLLCQIIESEFFDIAFDLVQKYRYLARLKSSDGDSALIRIALKEAAFSNEVSFNFGKRFIYSMLRMKRISENKSTRQQALRLVKCLCKHMESLDDEEARDIYKDVMFIAAHSGIPDVIKGIVETFPAAIYCETGEYRQHIFHVAIQNRCEKVFNLIYQTSGLARQYSDSPDSFGNTLLHLAASLAPPHKLNLVSGPALQMQREIQWFKEVEKFVSPYKRTVPNSAGKTPQMIFTEEHKNLKVEGEKWMKDTANSCTIVAALIVTMVFAAAITVPGGNKRDTGHPMFSKLSEFTIFAVSDAVSLFTSTTSLLMFLSILTSSYAEQDFLYALPKRLCIGLVTLFVSIFFMIVAFSMILLLVFGRKHAWVVAPVIALACLPIASFMFLQFPLLVAVISSTYGRGIFGNSLQVVPKARTRMIMSEKPNDGAVAIDIGEIEDPEYFDAAIHIGEIEDAEYFDAAIHIGEIEDAEYFDAED